MSFASRSGSPRAHRYMALTRSPLRASRCSGDARRINKVPTLVGNLPTVKHIASGGDHVLAVSADGYDVYSWGCGEKGQLGKEVSWDKGTTMKYLGPSEPFSVRLPAAGGATGGTVQARRTRVLNENFLSHLSMPRTASSPTLPSCPARPQTPPCHHALHGLKPHPAIMPCTAS